jgi:hypothetical protein
MKLRMNCFVAVVAVLYAGCLQASTITLAGFALYSSTSTGATNSTNFLYSSNPNFGFQAVTLTGTSPVVAADTFSIDFDLQLGDNTFALALGLVPGGFAGVDLFFSGDGTSYNPAAGTSRAPDLAAFVASYNNSASFAFPATGVLVHDYVDYGPLTYQDAYSGATSFVIGDKSVTVTALQFPTGAGTSGTMTLTVSQVPEPASLVMSYLGLIAIVGCAVRRRRRAFG